MRTIGRRSSRIIAELRQQLTRATVHAGPHDLTGRPVDPQEAWAALSNYSARLRELDASAGTYEIRVSGALRYELRRPTPAVPLRIDVVVDRSPDHDTTVSVFLDGELTDSDSAINVHVVDPGASGATHEWWDTLTSSAATLPATVRAAIDELADDYHDITTCQDDTAPHASAHP